MKKKLIVATLKSNDKAEFYTIEEQHKGLNLLRRQGTEEYFIYFDKSKAIAPIDKKEDFLEADPAELDWVFTKLFFWADSKIITSLGDPNYSRIIESFKQLRALKINCFNNQARYLEAMDNTGLIGKIVLFFYYHYHDMKTQRMVKRIVKELKIIW